MAQTAFTKAEARAKVGRWMQTRIAFAGVPEGVIDTITGIGRVIDGDDVEVAWGGAERCVPWVDWWMKVDQRGVRGPPYGNVVASSLSASRPRVQRQC